MKEEPMDRIIETTLAKDAERLRATFATVPNARIASLLALSNAPKGLLASFSAKVLLVAGTALVAGATAYFWPKPSVTHAPAVAGKVNTAGTAETSTIHVQNSTEMAPANFSQVPTKPGMLKAPPNWLQLNEGKGKSVKTITNSHYQPPLK